MKGCTVTILTCSEGERSEFSGVGTMERVGNCCRVRYGIEGDGGELSLFPHLLKMKRRGETSLDGEFSDGRESELLISTADFSGSVPVSTHFYRFSETKDGVFAVVEYALNFSSHCKIFHLQISVISEEA